MARGGGTASDGGAPGAPGRSGGAPGVPFEDVDLPATVRIGRPGTPDRALRVAAACLVAGLALAFAKPWSWGSPAAAPTQAPDVIATPAPAASAVPAALAPRRWTDLGASGSCLSNRLWMAVVDEEDDGGRTVTRSWTRLDPVPASDPTDPGIVRARVYAEAVPRIGFCAPAAAGTTERRLAVAAWRLEPGTAPDEATAVPIEPVILAGGAVADGGALYGPPTSSRSGIVPGEPGSPTAGGADARRRPRRRRRPRGDVVGGRRRPVATAWLDHRAGTGGRRRLAARDVRLPGGGSGGRGRRRGDRLGGGRAARAVAGDRGRAAGRLDAATLSNYSRSSPYSAAVAKTRPMTPAAASHSPGARSGSITSRPPPSAAMPATRATSPTTATAVTAA